MRRTTRATAAWLFGLMLSLSAYAPGGVLSDSPSTSGASPDIGGGGSGGGGAGSGGM